MLGPGQTSLVGNNSSVLSHNDAGSLVSKHNVGVVRSVIFFLKEELMWFAGTVGIRHRERLIIAQCFALNSWKNEGAIYIAGGFGERNVIWFLL